MLSDSFTIQDFFILRECTTAHILMSVAEQVLLFVFRNLVYCCSELFGETAEQRRYLERRKLCQLFTIIAD